MIKTKVVKGFWGFGEDRNHYLEGMDEMLVCTNMLIEKFCRNAIMLFKATLYCFFKNIQKMFKVVPSL